MRKGMLKYYLGTKFSVEMLASYMEYLWQSLLFLFHKGQLQESELI